MANARLYGFWGSLTEAVRTGEVQNESKGEGETLFAAIYADPDQLWGFLTAMSGISPGTTHAIAANFPWRDYKTFMDLGSAQGMVPATLARAHPHLTAAELFLKEADCLSECEPHEMLLNDDADLTEA
jgi:hypothetical protein